MPMNRSVPRPPFPLPPAPLRIAVVQARSSPGEVAANARTAAAHITRAAEGGASLVVLPELFLPSYDLPAIAAAPDRHVVPTTPRGTVPDGRLDPVREAAAGAGVLVLIGAAVGHPGRSPKIATLAADPTGHTSVVYCKQHLWGEEAAFFTPGHRGVSLDLDGWILGLGICYDASFPEHGRAAALDGAHAYVCPSAFAAGRQTRAEIYHRARALENTMFSVMANPVGRHGAYAFTGGSSVYSPVGQVVTKATRPRERVLIAYLDPQRLADARAHLRMPLECDLPAGPKPHRITYRLGTSPARPGAGARQRPGASEQAAPEAETVFPRVVDEGDAMRGE
ncbi:carbon-nitrogen hydrolase family protein [Streptomyces netropsis]|uniref:carbon-nitrogen hydrolase family protein n=1 Tax=Streptomyces netropsis TaxID=55404 RepID=UPI00378F318C